jgi:membrane protease YdiL (CAAX protease family)
MVANNGGARPSSGPWSKVPVALRAILTGLAIGMIAANVWPLLLLNLGAPIASVAELIFLGVYLWWAAGGGAPKRWQTARAEAFRATRLSRDQWIWGLVAAVFFAATVHSSIVLLFRFVPFPLAAFRQGYDFSFIPTVPLRWLAVVVSAMSAGVCEEVGFRGYMQRPIELRYGAPIAILISSLFFMALHLTKAWALLGMVPIVFGAGVLLGLLARSAGSLIPCIIGHTIMDIGLFAYWWTGIAGDFPERPLSETGLDAAFCVACVVFLLSLSLVLLVISRLRRLRHATD